MFDTTLANLLADETSANFDLYIKSTLTDWDVSGYTHVAVAVTNADCDCSPLAWTNPPTTQLTVSVGTTVGEPTVPVAISNTLAMATSIAFENCYLTAASPGCSTEGQFTTGSILYRDSTGSDVALPAWITFVPSGASAQTLTIDPDYTNIGTHTLVATYTTTYGDDPYYEALEITVDCTVISFTKPVVNPSDLVYTIWNTQEAFNADTLVYT